MKFEANSIIYFDTATSCGCGLMLMSNGFIFQYSLDSNEIDRIILV
jgi:hypothetical protein